MLCRRRGTIEIRTRSRCFADIFRATRTGADHLKSSPGRIRTVDPLFVRQVPSPLGHRTMLLFVERRPWESNPQVFRPAVFKTASSPIRVTSVAMIQSTGDRNRTCGLLVQSQTQLPAVPTPGQVMRRTERCWLSFRKLGEEDSNLYHLIQSQVAYR